MNCIYCNKQLRNIKKDWAIRKYHKSCFKKQKETWYVDKLVTQFNQLNVSNFGGSCST